MGQKRSVIGREWRILISAVLLASTLVAAASGQTKARPQLYLVAIDDVPLEMMNRLVSHFHTKFEITVQMLPPVALDRLTFDPERVQLVADKLIQAVRQRYPELAKDPRARVIAITRFDMFMEALRNEWRFTFSLRSRDRRFAVVSYARMDPANYREAPDERLLQSRLRKMVTKNIGIMYFGLPASGDPRSVLFGNILGIDDLDRMTEEFAPR